MAVLVYNGNTLISSGNTMVYDTLTNGTVMYVYSNGVASSTRVLSGGTLNVSNNGIISNCSVQSRGKIYVSNGGSANTTTVGQLGFLHVLQGAIADKTTVSSGYMHISSGAVANTVVLSARGSATIYSGGTANMTTIYSNGHLEVHNGGVANAVDIHASGNAYIYSGGKANNLTLSSAGTLDVYSGGQVDSVTLDYATLNISNGAVANSNTINAGGELHVSKGGLANINVISGKTSQYDKVVGNQNQQVTEHILAKMTVSSGGIASSNTVDYLGNINVLSGGYIQKTEITENGSVDVRVYGNAKDTTVNEGGTLNIYGSANETVVNSNGTLNVYTSGQIFNTQINSMGSGVISSGFASNTTVTDGTLEIYGGTVNTTTLTSAAIMTIALDGNANDTTVNSAASLFVLDYGVASNTVVSSGGTLLAYTLTSLISNNGTTINNTILSGGQFGVAAGGIASNTTIEKDAVVLIDNGGIHRGTITFADGASMTTKEGSIIDFSVSAITPKTEGYLINNLAAITGAPTYTITVSKNQQDGTYKLAQNAGSLADKTLTISAGNRELGVLKVNGETLTIDGITYDLNLKENNLVLIVEGSIEGGTSQYITGNFGVDGMVFELKSYGIGYIHSTTDKIKLEGAVDTNKWELLGSGDFIDGNNIDGLLWMEKATGNVYVQNDLTNFDEVLNKTNYIGTFEDGYKFLAAGNFASDAVSGVLMQGPAFGDASTSLNYGLPVWESEAGSQYSGWLGALVNTWQPGDDLKGDLSNIADINTKNYKYDVIAVGDFNGDGVDDVLLQNTMPTMVDGIKITGSGDVFAFLSGDTDAVKAGADPTVAYAGCATGGWEILGAGDFDGDGTDDILLSNGTGLAGWKMKDGARVADFDLQYSNLSTNQEIAGIVDINGDGTDDLLVLSTDTNTLSGWKVENGTVTGHIAIV